eukprot:scaffold124337_cov66-Phaeocystis_antarctica.AAC.3
MLVQVVGSDGVLGQMTSDVQQVSGDNLHVEDGQVVHAGDRAGARGRTAVHEYLADAAPPVLARAAIRVGHENARLVVHHFPTPPAAWLKPVKPLRGQGHAKHGHELGPLDVRPPGTWKRLALREQRLELLPVRRALLPLPHRR